MTRQQELTAKQAHPQALWTLFVELDAKTITVNCPYSATVKIPLTFLNPDRDPDQQSHGIVSC